MKVTVYVGLNPVVIENVTTVLVESDRGTPLSVTSEYGPTSWVTRHCDEPGMETLLNNLGLDRTVVVTKVKGPTLADVGGVTWDS